MVPRTGSNLFIKLYYSLIYYVLQNMYKYRLPEKQQTLEWKWWNSEWRMSFIFRFIRIGKYIIFSFYPLNSNQGQLWTLRKTRFFNIDSFLTIKESQNFCWHKFHQHRWSRLFISKTNFFCVLRFIFQKYQHNFSWIESCWPRTWLYLFY